MDNLTIALSFCDFHQVLGPFDSHTEHEPVQTPKINPRYFAGLYLSSWWEGGLCLSSWSASLAWPL